MDSGREWLAKLPDNTFAPSSCHLCSQPRRRAIVMQCKIIPEPHIQNTYDLFLGEVVAAWTDERVFSGGRWHFEGHDDLRTIHYIAGGAFIAIGEAFKIGT